MEDKILSVSDASNLLKAVVENAFSSVRVQGELSQITKASSGHVYMTIKDNNSAISVIIWKSTPVNFKLEEGLEVIITGKFTTYPARSNYQLIVNKIEIAGIGTILKMLEERKQKLAKEGLFDNSRKKILPYLPKRIGIITSQTGAAFRDIQNRLKERFPVEVLLFHATVQGTTAAAEVIKGIEYFNTEKNVDVIIVARGGGSLEDLLPFSDEILVRTVANSTIPIISGVGHEPDWMLIDFASDMRAATPTMAAEIVVPTKISLIQDLDNLSHRITTNITSKIIGAKDQLKNISIKSPKQIIMEWIQKLDDIQNTINAHTNNKIVNFKQQMLTLNSLENLIKNRFFNINQSMNHLADMLSTLSYKNVLKRGFTIVRDSETNKIIDKSEKFKKPAKLEFFDKIIDI